MELPSKDVLSLKDIWDRVKAAASAIKNNSNELRTKTTVDNVTTVKMVLDYCANIKTARTTLSALVPVSGLQAFADADTGGTAPNLQTKFAVVDTAVSAVVAWVGANTPQQAGTRYILAESIDDSAVTTPRTFTAAQLNQLRTQIDVLLATIS